MGLRLLMRFVQLELVKNDVNIVMLMVSEGIDSLNGFVIQQTVFFHSSCPKKSGLSD